MVSVPKEDLLSLAGEFEVEQVQAHSAYAMMLQPALL